MKVLLCGGAGYIGTHVALAFLEGGHKVGIFDDFSSGLRENVQAGTTLYEGSILDEKALEATLSDRWDVVVHLAAFKAAGESMTNPSKYAHNNITGSLNMIRLCERHSIKKFILSSSAAVYGEPVYLPIDENHPLKPMNYYGYTKQVIEDNLRWFHSLAGMNYVSLRYFNAAGYDRDGRMKGLERNPANLIPVVMEAALGKRERLDIFGDDYPTADGTGIRDYVHVTDLADAHVKGAEYLMENDSSLTVNLGSEEGLSVKEILDEARKVSGIDIPYRIVGRREGDPAKLVASSTLARQRLEWTARHSSLEELIETTWKAYKG
ncbi:MAG: UDP-glucose 4-epimerase GalE [Sphaerochaetaceae bacterium]|nr:UDP-glucose 4-epimerase GalE [Sphaerochaetaceae bacterium]